MSVEPLREVRDHFSEVIDRVEHEHERVTVTRNGRAAAGIVSPDDLAELEETVEIIVKNFAGEAPTPRLLHAAVLGQVVVVLVDLDRCGGAGAGP